MMLLLLLAIQASCTDVFEQIKVDMSLAKWASAGIGSGKKHSTPIDSYFKSSKCPSFLTKPLSQQYPLKAFDEIKRDTNILPCVNYGNLFESKIPPFSKPTAYTARIPMTPSCGKPAYQTLQSEIDERKYLKTQHLTPMEPMQPIRPRYQSSERSETPRPISMLDTIRINSNVVSKYDTGVGFSQRDSKYSAEFFTLKRMAEADNLCQRTIPKTPEPQRSPMMFDDVQNDASSVKRAYLNLGVSYLKTPNLGGSFLKTQLWERMQKAKEIENQIFPESSLLSTNTKWKISVEGFRGQEFIMANNISLEQVNLNHKDASVFVRNPGLVHAIQNSCNLIQTIRHMKDLKGHFWCTDFSTQSFISPSVPYAASGTWQFQYVSKTIYMQFSQTFRDLPLVVSDGKTIYHLCNHYSVDTATAEYENANQDVIYGHRGLTNFVKWTDSVIGCSRHFTPNLGRTMCSMQSANRNQKTSAKTWFVFLQLEMRNILKPFVENLI